MKDRLYTLLCAAGALLLSIFLLASPVSVDDETVSQPTTEDAGRHGLKGLSLWLRENRVPTYPWRKRFTDLQVDSSLAAGGNVLILSLPPQREWLDSEWHALRQWIRRGNTVLILGAAYTRPAWSDSGGCFCEVRNLLADFDWSIKRRQAEPETTDLDKSGAKRAEIQRNTGLAEQTEVLKDQVQAFDAVETELKPGTGLPLLQNISVIKTHVIPVELEQDWILQPDTSQLAMQLLQLQQEDPKVMMWLLEAGQGQIFLSLSADLFANDTLGKADNALFFSNILDQSLAAKGQVIFDDYHFGLSDLYDPERFFNDVRLYQTVGFVLLLWLLYVLGYTNRLAPVKAVMEKPSVRDFVDAMAGYFARSLDRKTVAQQIARLLIADIRRWKKLPDEESVRHWLLEHPSLHRNQVTVLLQAEQKKYSQLEKLTIITTEIREKILL